MRPAKIIGNLFVLFVLIVMSTIYYTYVAVVFGPKLIGKRILRNDLFPLFRKLFDQYNACRVSYALRDACVVLLPINDHRPRPGSSVLGLPSR